MTQEHTSQENIQLDAEPRDDARMVQHDLPHRKKQTRAPIFIGIFMGLLLVAAVYLVWDQWFSHDDARDIQGIWHIEGSQSDIVIDADSIYLTDTVIYRYEIDTFAQTLTIDYYGRQGLSSYEFSPDRTRLTLTDDNPSSDGRGLPDEPTGAITTTLIKVSDAPATTDQEDGSDDGSSADENEGDGSSADEAE